MLGAGAALLAALALPAGAAHPQDKDWGKREKLDPNGTTAKAEAVVCPVCDHKCERGVMANVQEHELDTDFKVLRASFNVYPYVLTTCPKCSYSTYSAQFHKSLKEEQRKNVMEALKDTKRAFRDSWAVPLSFSLDCAAITHRTLKSGEGTLSEIYLLGSYLAREAGEAEAEREMQRNAASNLIVAIEKDESYQRPKLRYLAGEIYRRLGQHKDALDWLGRARQDADEELQKLIARQEMLTRDEIEKKKPKK